VIAAKFARMGDASAALGWFTNQALPVGSLRIFAVQGSSAPRAPKAGDDARRDVTWIVAVDIDRARLRKIDALDTLRREGGAVLARLPDGM